MALQVATVFSGIGAIEHSLERMGIEHDIVFACDNSNIDWSEKLTKTMKMVDLLVKLDELNYSYTGIRRLSNCWNPKCSSDSLALVQHPIVSTSEIDEKEIKKLDNIALLCAECHLVSSNQQLNLPNLKSVLNQIIGSIGNFKIKREIVNQLYLVRGKKAFVEESYLANYNVPEEHFHKDVTFLDGKPYEGKVDLLVGGSPCQSFSFVGHQGGFDDARGTLFYDFVRLVDEIKPKMFLWENVKGVYTHDKLKTWEVISKCFDNTDYTWHHAVLNSKDYGIPQHRQRVFVIGFQKGGENFTFPKPSDLKTTMQDFLEDQVAGKYFLNTKGVSFVTWDKNHRKQYTQIDGEIMLCQKANQQFNWHGDFVFVEENKGQHIVDEKHFLSQKVERYVLASGTKGFSSKPETDLKIARPLLATLFKNHRAGVDNYVTTEGRLRMLTPTECLRLMGFCDSFKQVVSNIQLYRQAGNSIVVDVLIAIIAQAIPVLASSDSSFEYLQERAIRVQELFNELPERQIQHSDIERIVAALVD
jgi:DNA (cytosine-5)-methyltransferase 1